MSKVSRMRFGSLRVNLRLNGDIWHYELFIEGKQYRQSLRTSVLADARDAATALTVELLAKQKSGQKVFSITIGDARREFLMDLDKRVKQGTLAERTAANTSRHVDWGLKFLNSVHITANAALDTIRADIWKGYADWRLKDKPFLNRTVIQQELVSIRSLFKFAKENGQVSEANIPKWELQTEEVRRKRISPKDVVSSLNAVSKWVGKDERRQMFYTVLRTMLGSGMRTGEVLNLKRGDVETGTKFELTIHIAKTKTGKPRTITVMDSGGAWLRDWIDKHPDQEQLFDYTMFYQMLKQARRDKILTIDPYHCRHEFGTREILKNQPLALIAAHMGTSTGQLERTYNQTITSMIGRQFAKTKLERKEDGTVEVVKR